ncbi:Flagellar FliJ protein [compost metagenome]
MAKQGGAQGPALMEIHEFLKGQRQRIQFQEQKVQEFEKLVEAKREILRQAAMDYKIMEKMRENKFEAYRQERIATEQKENDEQSILRFKAVKES